MQCFVLIVLQPVNSFRCETTGASHWKLAQARIPLLLAAALSLLVIRLPLLLSDLWLLFIWPLQMRLSENSVPLHPMVLLIIIPMKNGYFIGGIPHFQTYPNRPSVSNLSGCWLAVQIRELGVVKELCECVPCLVEVSLSLDVMMQWKARPGASRLPQKAETSNVALSSSQAGCKVGSCSNPSVPDGGWISCKTVA